MKRILIIDDDQQFRNKLKQLLERNGYDVIAAPDGKQGLKLYRNAPTDLVITDIIMPEKEGIEVIIELRRDFPGARIIAVSGGGRIDPNEYLNMAKPLGANQTFSKPFDRKKILQAVKELLDEALVK